MPQYQGVSHLSNLSPLYDHTGKLFNTDTSIIPVGGGGGRYVRNFWVEMCRWDTGTLILYES